MGSKNENLESTDFRILEERFKDNVLNKLEENKIYRMLISVKYEENGNINGSGLHQPMKSIMINHRMNSLLILERIQRDLRKFEYEYNIMDYSGLCYIGWKEWLSVDDYNNKNKKIDRILSEVIDEDKNSRIKFKNVNKNVVDGSLFKDINNLLPRYNSIDNLLELNKICVKNKDIELSINSKVKELETN